LIIKNNIYIKININLKYLQTYENLTNKIIGYHVAPRKLDNEIYNNGIKNVERKGYKHGEEIMIPIKNYFWLDFKYADWFKNYHEDEFLNDEPQKMTIWEIDLTGLELIEDTEAIDMSSWSSEFEKDENGQAVYTTHNISPKRILNKYK
jgi:hypothetical protein